MKSYKFLFVVLIVVIIFSLSACLYIPKSYACDTDMVESVQIIKLGAWNDTTERHQFAVLADVVDHSDFIERLNNLKDNDFVFILGTPGTLFEGDILIKVNYLNGDYDLVKSTVQIYYRSGKAQGGGYVTFNQEEYDKLIADYLPILD